MVLYESIVVGTDFSPRADLAIQAAVDVARRNDGKLTLVHILDTSGTGALPYDLTGEDQAAQEQEALDASRARLRDMAEMISGVPVEISVRRGHPAKELARAAAAVQADLIVTATQGFGAIKRAVLGSVTTSLLGYASCPVLVVGEHRDSQSPPKKVLAAVDLSPVSAEVLDHAFGFARPGGVRVVSVFDQPVLISGDHPFSLQAYALPARVRKLDEQREAVSKLAKAKAIEGVPYEVTVVPGAPPHLEVLDVARSVDPDLIVVGASGHRTWSKALFGTNAAKIIAGCHVPVLVVPDAAHRPASSAERRGLPKNARERREQIVYAAVASGAVPSMITRLADAGIESDHLSVVMSKETHAERFKAEDSSDEGFVAGSVVGGSVGGVLGGLASLAASSGIGVVVVGPAVALGLIGGLVGTLVGYGVPEHDAARLQDAVDTGQALVAVHAYDGDEVRRAKTAFADAGAQPRRLFL